MRGRTGKEKWIEWKLLKLAEEQPLLCQKPLLERGGLCLLLA